MLKILQGKWTHLRESFAAGEWQGFFPKITLFFLISLVYQVLRPVKTSLVISAPGSGAEIIPFLKVWGVLPGAVVFTFLFTYLLKRLNREQVFYAMVSFFIVFFFGFMTVLYPYRDWWELKSFAEALGQILPQGMNGLLAMVRHWHLTLFYMFSELWGSVVLSMLFWGFINETSTLKEAARFYGLYALCANSATILAGQIGVYVSESAYDPSLPFGSNSWEQSVTLISGVAVLCGCLIIGVFRYINRFLPRPEVSAALDRPSAGESKEEDDSHFSLFESFQRVFSSKHLLYLTMIVVSYNLAFNLVDVILTNQLHLRFNDDIAGLNAYISKVTIANGVVATIFAVFFTENLIKKVGWLGTALATPLIVLVTSVFLFPFLLGDPEVMGEFAMSVTGVSLLGLTVFLSSMQNSLTRAAKYTLFDATKEMSFIPLPRASQRKGKAAIDGICSRFGKSGGSLIYQMLFIFCATIQATLPYISVIVFIVLGAWIWAVVGLNEELQKEIPKDVKKDLFV